MEKPDYHESTSGSGNEESDNLVSTFEAKEKPETFMDFGNMIWEYSMYAVAVFLFLFGVLIWHFSLTELLSNSSVPPVIDAPCFFTFFLLGVIFLALGFSIREIENEKTGSKIKSSPDTTLPVHSEFSFSNLKFEDEKEEKVFKELLKNKKD